MEEERQDSGLGIMIGEPLIDAREWDMISLPWTKRRAREARRFKAYWDELDNLHIAGPIGNLLATTMAQCYRADLAWYEDCRKRLEEQDVQEAYGLDNRLPVHWLDRYTHEVRCTPLDKLRREAELLTKLVNFPERYYKLCDLTDSKALEDFQLFLKSQIAYHAKVVALMKERLKGGRDDGRMAD